ncbi:MAG TPA: hypothetical protein VMH27_00720 [Puia sp.]|nr:hypothetical protein [Puia sp.]
MKKGKTLTVLVLVLEIATISILHAVKISHTEKTAGKEISKNSPQETGDIKQKSTYSFAVFR